MKYFKYKITVKMSGYRCLVIRGIASTKKQRLTNSKVTERITERIAAMVKQTLKQKGEISAGIINSIKFKTTAEVLPVDFIIDLDIPMVGIKVSRCETVPSLI